MQLDISLVNKVLANINNICPHTGFSQVDSERLYTGVPDGEYDGRQGEFNEDKVIYTHRDLPSDVLVEVTTRTDSYGEGEAVVSIQFGKAVEKTVKVFESI